MSKPSRSENTALKPTTKSEAELEKLCNHCGKCCYQKVYVGRSVFLTPFPCEFLDVTTNLCTVYDRRHEVNPNCLSMADGFKVSAFPEDCPYVPELAPKRYKPAREDYDWGSEWDEFDLLADDMEVSPATRELVRKRGPDAPPMYVEVNERAQQKGGPLWGDGAGVHSMTHTPEVDPATIPSLSDLARGCAEPSKERPTKSP